MNRNDTEPESMEREPSNNSDADMNNANLNDNRGRKKKLIKNKEEQRENMTTSGLLFIITFQVQLQKDSNRKRVKEYMQRVLHSIFFLGHINDPPISPSDFIPSKTLKQYEAVFPKPFQEYNTHLPSQTPYSILLEYMTETLNTEEPQSFMKELVAVNESLWKISDKEENQLVANDFAFSASVITYSCIKDVKTQRFLEKVYGASMSCKGRIPRRVMIAISVLYVWDKAISYAVCCGAKGTVIKFPDHVHCNAFKFDNQNRRFKETPPCTKCNTIYDAQFNPKYSGTNKPEDWPFGNCAENESLSKLLQLNRELRDAIHTVSENGDETLSRNEIENKFKDEHEDKMKKEVHQYLWSRKFHVPLEQLKLFIPDVPDV